MLTKERLEILQHSLGLDEYGRGRAYRNHYVCDPGDANVDANVADGLMVDRGPNQMCGGMHLYMVTPAGEKVIREQSPKPPKFSREKERYMTWLRSGCDMSFGEWIKGRWYAKC